MIDRLDHLVLTVKDVEASCDFYSHVLGMKVISFGDGRRALCFGNQKINLHQLGQSYEPKAENPTPGSSDLCFVMFVPLSTMQEHLHACGIPVIEGPVRRVGATGPLVSLYIRDPDLNLIEVATYDETSSDS